MRKTKKILTTIIAIALAIALSACTVPYTYVSVAGNYVKDNPEEFHIVTDAIHEGIREAIDSGTTDEETREFMLELFGIEDPEGPQTSENTETENVPETEESNAEKPEVPANPDQQAGQEKPDPSNQGRENASEPGREEKDESAAENKNTDSETEQEGSESDSSPAQEKSRIESTYIPEYEHIEKSDFDTACEAFEQAVKDNDSKKIPETYQTVYELMKRISSMNSIAYINYAMDVNDGYFKSEYKYSEKLNIDCGDRFMTACLAAAKSKSADIFEDCASEAIVKAAKEYEPLTDRAKELSDQEIELIDQYNTEYDHINDISYEMNGKTYTVGDLLNDSSDLMLLAFFNYEHFLAVYQGLLSKVNEKLGPIYLELLQVRVELAKEYGYDSYADYCYKNSFGRSYTTEDAAVFCEAIKKYVGKDYYNNAYFYFDNSFGSTIKLTTQNMLDALDRFTAGFNDQIHDSYTEFEQKKLYDIGSGEGRLDGCFTVSLDAEDLAFVFLNVDENFLGLDFLEHEFGHFVDFMYEAKNYESYGNNDNYDVMEIHSTAMELLCSNHYGEILGVSEAEKTKKYTLSKALDSILEGCIQDEFQREIYMNPTMSLKEINQLYADICKEYGQMEAPGDQYTWVLINHTFETPMYYISYAISALSALEIWNMSKEDEAKAVDTWMTVMKEADDEDYDTVMKNAGLTPFTDTIGVVDLCRDILDEF